MVPLQVCFEDVRIQRFAGIFWPCVPAVAAFATQWAATNEVTKADFAWDFLKNDVFVEVVHTFRFYFGQTNTYGKAMPSGSPKPSQYPDPRGFLCENIKSRSSGLFHFHPPSHFADEAVAMLEKACKTYSSGSARDLHPIPLPMTKQMYENNICKRA
jgi:hypothetical protein